QNPDAAGNRTASHSHPVRDTAPPVQPRRRCRVELHETAINAPSSPRAALGAKTVRMNTAPLPDAAGQNWVDRHAPERLKPWLKLGRFDRPIGTWLLLLPGWQGIMLALNQYDRPFGGYELWLVVGFAIGAALMRGAGCAVNDIV